MLKHTLKLLLAKATTLLTKLGGSKTRWLLNKIKLTYEMKTVFHCKEWWAASLFILFPGLFEIIAQSADGTEILFLEMGADVVRKWVLWAFLHFGVLSHTAKGTKWVYQPKLDVLGWSAALMDCSCIHMEDDFEILACTLTCFDIIAVRDWFNHISHRVYISFNGFSPLIMTFGFNCVHILEIDSTMSNQDAIYWRLLSWPYEAKNVIKFNCNPLTKW